MNCSIVDMREMCKLSIIFSPLQLSYNYIFMQKELMTCAECKCGNVITEQKWQRSKKYNSFSSKRKQIVARRCVVPSYYTVTIIIIVPGFHTACMNILQLYWQVWLGIKKCYVDRRYWLIRKPIWQVHN